VLALESSCTRCRRIGESIGSKAVGGCGDIAAVGSEARRGPSNDSLGVQVSSVITLVQYASS